jgi:sec-independent protein translocase protein TatB
MFGISSTEILLIAIVALVVLGPSKLPQVMRTVGRGLAEFRRMSTDVKSTLDNEVRRMEEEDREREAAEKAKAAEAKKAKAEAAAEAASEPAAETVAESEPVAEKEKA